MQRFYTALIAMIGAAEALKVTSGATRGTDTGAIAEDADKNDDFGLVAEEGQEQEKFLEWVSQNGKNYSSNEEMEERMQNWTVNNTTIREENRAALASGRHNPAMYNHNEASDLNGDELEKRLALKLEDDEETVLISETTTGVDVTAGTHDWAWATKPVYDQGTCGSCWAFAGNTVLEGTDYIYSGGDRLSLSHQLPVSCAPQTAPDYLFGCNGGDARRMWNWYMANGTTSESNYPYSQDAYVSGITGTCDIDMSTLDQGLVTATGKVTSYPAMVDMIASRPLVGSFAINSSVFSFYSFGLIQPNDGNCFSPGTQTNHQMAVVGLDLVGEGTTAQVPQEQMWARWKSPTDQELGCQGEDEFELAQYPMYCLWYTVTYTTQTLPSGAFWKIQNSWGTGWGHQGFAYFALDENETVNGNCSMYKNGMQWVETSSM